MPRGGKNHAQGEGKFSRRAGQYISSPLANFSCTPLFILLLEKNTIASQPKREQKPFSFLWISDGYPPNLYLYRVDDLMIFLSALFHSPTRGNYCESPHGQLSATARLALEETLILAQSPQIKIAVGLLFLQLCVHLNWLQPDLASSCFRADYE